MTATRGRPRTPGAARQAEPSRKTVTIAIQVPEEPWHQFQIALVLDEKKMQEWVNQRVNALLARDWDGLKPKPYRRVPRGKGPTRQVIARIPTEKMRPLQLRLAKLALPMSTWLYDEILAYIRGLDERLEKAKHLVKPQV